MIMNIVKNKNCVKTQNMLNYKVPKKSDWYVYGQRSGNYNILQPEKFNKSGYYLIRYGVNERLFSSPKIFRKQSYINFMNKKPDCKM